MAVISLPQVKSERQTVVLVAPGTLDPHARCAVMNMACILTHLCNFQHQEQQSL